VRLCVQTPLRLSADSSLAPRPRDLHFFFISGWALKWALPIKN
jgi:hypothetical protein